MPSLTPHDRLSLLGPRLDPCVTCTRPRVRHYCRTCDQFFETCGCALGEGEHADHRVYLWTPTGIIARPNYDFDDIR